MARKAGNRKARVSTETVAVERPPSPVWGMGWLLSFLMLISAARSGPFCMVRVLPPEVDSVLAPEWAWETPVSLLPGLNSFAECPYWVYAAVVSFLIAQFVAARFQTRQAEAPKTGVKFIILAAVSLSVLAVDLATVACVLAAAHFMASPRFDSSKLRRVSIIPAIAASAAVAMCIDFGIVLFMLLVGWLKHSGGCVRNRLIVLSGLVIVIGGGMAFSHGFAAAMARPLTWMGVGEQHLPMIPVSGNSFGEWMSFGLTLAVVSHSWWLAWSGERRTVAQLVPLLIFSLLSLTCRYYHWIALTGVVSCSEYVTLVRRPLLPSSLLKWSLIPIVLLGFATQYESYLSFVLTGRWPQQFVDPALWDTSGHVMLMQPEHSSRWQSERLRKSFKLIVDDRWDLFSAEYRNYQLVCRDISEFRHSRYLRTDGSWGGYKQWTEQWKPTLLAVDSSDLDGIRRLSLSPDWNVVGIDSQRTILAAAKEPANAPQIREAGRLFSELEWPSTQFGGSYGDVIVANGNVAQTSVAQVLLAMRLPYAALRVMPETNNLSDNMTVMCHFEIAHRVFRHAQTHSLLDQYRAIYHLRTLVENNRLPAKQLLRVARGLEQLSEYETGIEFATQLVKQPEAASAQERQWATELIERCQLRVAAETRHDHNRNSEASIRQALRSGDQPAVAEALKVLKGRERDFFQSLAGAITKPPEDVYFELIELVNSADFPDQLHGEALFYLGCLALEVGDSSSAANAFSASIQAAPTQPLNSVSRISLMNLQKHSR